MATDDRITGVMMVGMLAMGLALLIITNDFSAMNVTLPEIEQTFDSDISTVQWVINAYALVFAVLIITGGRIDDMFGRRRMFFVGAIIFGVMSFIGGFAPNIYLLIVMRGLMGIGGALIWPATLGMTYALLPKSKAGLAGGFIIGVAGIGQAIGPLVGGVLTEFLSWRWVLYINLPIALITALVVWRAIPADAKNERDDEIDYAGSALLSIGLLALLFALDQSAAVGWTSWQILLSLAVAVVCLAVFVFVERRVGERALVPRTVMGNRQFTVICVALALISPVFFVTLLYLPQYMQKFLGYSALESGLGLLPMMVVFAVVSFIAGSVYDRIGAKLTMAIGALFLTLGPLALVIIPDDAGLGWLVPGMVFAGIGIGMFFSSATTNALSRLRDDQTSLGGGIVYMFNLAGGMIGLALATAIFSATSVRQLSDDAAKAGITLTSSEEQSLQGLLIGTDTASQITSKYDASTADQLLEIAQDSFLKGFQFGMILTTITAFAAFLLVVVVVEGSLVPKPLEDREQALRDEFRRFTHRAHA